MLLTESCGRALNLVCDVKYHPEKKRMRKMIIVFTESVQLPARTIKICNIYEYLDILCIQLYMCKLQNKSGGDFPTFLENQS